MSQAFEKLHKVYFHSTTPKLSKTMLLLSNLLPIKLQVGLE